MTDERDPESGDKGESTGDGLDAWLAANFPGPPAGATPHEPAATPFGSPPPTSPPPSPPTPSMPPPPAGAWPPVPPPAGPQNPFAHLPPPADEPPAREPHPTGPGFPPMAEELGGIPPAAEFPPPPTEAFADVSGPSGIDALFGEAKFREYEEGPTASESPFAKRAPEPALVSRGRSGSGGRPRGPQKVLLWIAGVLFAALALVALFMVGTRLPAILGPAPGAAVTPSTSPSASPSPTPTVAPIGPVEPGEYLWDELLGGECVNPYEGPWQIKYTVVDCETPHAAQLVTRGEFVLPEGTFAYPGVEALQSQVNLLCTAPAVVDYAAASAYTDIQFEASYALSADDWVEGNRAYNCFLSRSEGGELTGSIAVPQVAPEPEPSEEPAP